METARLGEPLVAELMSLLLAELRQPLAVVNGAIGALRRGAATDVEQTLTEEIDRAARRISAIVDSAAAFSVESTGSESESPRSDRSDCAIEALETPGAGRSESIALTANQ